jgi:large subunit ribosomal protein L29
MATKVKTKVKFRDLSTSDLQNQLESLRKELREARFEYGITRTIQNPARVRKVKKDIARILTILHERNRNTGV